MIFRNAIAICVATFAFAGASIAGQCGYQKCWGAVAIGPGGAWGAAHSYTSEQAAANAAQGGCEGDCNNIRTFYNQCGALAEGSNGNWGFGYGGTRDIAEVNALSACYDYGPNCGIRAYSCSY